MTASETLLQHQFHTLYHDLHGCLSFETATIPATEEILLKPPEPLKKIFAFEITRKSVHRLNLSG